MLLKEESICSWLIGEATGVGVADGFHTSDLLLQWWW